MNECTGFNIKISLGYAAMSRLKYTFKRGSAVSDSNLAGYSSDLSSLYDQLFRGDSRAGELVMRINN